MLFQERKVKIFNVFGIIHDSDIVKKKNNVDGSSQQSVVLSMIASLNVSKAPFA